MDYSLPRSSRYILFLDAPFRYSWRHLIQYFNANIIRKQTGIEFLKKKEQLLHFGLAFLEILPVLGMAVALVDRLIFYKKPKIVTEYSKRDIDVTCNMVANVVPIYCKIFGSDAQKQASLQEAFILPRYIDEMKQLAHSSGISYSNILLANTILDRLGLFGGSIKASNKTATKIATNYFHSQGRGETVLDVYKSFWRYDMLNKPSESSRKALLKVCMQETIASCIYDGANQKLLWAFGSDYSANRPYRRYNLKPLLQKSQDITLLHNIDCPMGLLAPFTRLFVRKKTAHSFAFVSVGWLGLVGTYSGINEHGLAVAACNVPKLDGLSQAANPNHLIIRQILEEAKTIEDAQRIIEKTTPSAPMNLIIACTARVVRIELSRPKFTDQKN